jgi:hypothetical protein
MEIGGDEEDLLISLIIPISPDILCLEWTIHAKTIIIAQ